MTGWQVAGTILVGQVIACAVFLACVCAREWHTEGRERLRREQRHRAALQSLTLTRQEVRPHTRRPRHRLH